MAATTSLVTQITGQVWVRGADGSLTPVHQGMRVPVDADIVTATGASVQLQADGLPPMTIGENRDVQLSAETVQPNVDTSTAAVAAPADPDVAQVLAALNAGDDPLANLDPTAAVLGGGGGDGGSSFTRLVGIVETTSPLGLEYPRGVTPPVDTVQFGSGTGDSGDDGTGIDNGNAGVGADDVAPSVLVSINNDGTVSFNFSEVPFGFTVEDIAVANGSLSNLRPDPTDLTQWTADLTPAPDFEGDVTVTVPDGSYTDVAGNPGGSGSDNTPVDTLAPEASIEIDAIAEDNVINASEANADVAVSGTVGGDVKVGDTVTLTVGNNTYTTTVLDGNTWTVNVPGSVLAGTDNVHASVTTTDAAGNSASATDDQDYGVDTLAPEARIEIDNITEDNVINAAEANADVAVSGTVGGDVKVGDTVTLTVGNNTYTTTVLDGNTWTVNVPGSVLAENGNVHASVTTTDTAGNSASATDDQDYGVDTVAPEASIEIDAITTDNVINGDESGQEIAVSGTVGGDVKVGDTVTLTVGTNTYTTTVLEGNTWTVNVPGSVLAGTDNVHASVTTTDTAGNSASAADDQGYGVDTLAPEASIEINAITDDNVINAAEANADVAVSGTVGGDVKVGDTVTLTVGTNTYTTTVLEGNTWTVNVPGSVLAGTDNVHASVTTTDTAGNSASATDDQGYGVDTLAPEASIEIDAITTDNVINGDESGQEIAVSGTVGGDVKVGDTVTLTVGTNTYTTTVLEGNTWTVNVPGSVLAGSDNVHASVTTTDTAGNSASATDDQGYGVDTLAPEASIEIDAITDDNVINAAEANADVAVSGTVGGDVKVGDTVTLTVGTNTYTTTVLEGNTWTVNVPGSVLAGTDNVHASVTTTDTAGNSASAADDQGYALDTVAPEASIEINAITDDNVINATEANGNVAVSGTVGGDVKVGDTVTLTVGTNTYTTTVLEGNTWTVNVPGSVLAGTDNVHASVTTTDTAGNSASATDDQGYGVDTLAPEASIEIDAITDDNVINAAEANADVAVSGTVGGDVKVGDTVTLTVGTNTYTTTVLEGNTWTVNVPGSVLAGTDNVHASVTTTDTAGNSASAADDQGYALDTVAPEASIEIDAITDDNVINAAEANADVAVSGTVGGDVKVGDTVTLTVGTNTYTTTVLEGNTWTVNVPGSVLAGSDNVHASVTTTDTAGNSASAADDQPYEVNNTGPSIEGGTAIVSEEGLHGGIADSNPQGSDTTNNTHAQGQLEMGQEQGVEVRLEAPTEDMTSGGKEIEWKLEDDSQTLTGRVSDGHGGFDTVVTVTIDDDGKYKVDLERPIDHPAGQGENVSDITVGVVATDAQGNESKADLTIRVEDDAPVANGYQHDVELSTVSTNLMMVIDLSASMDYGSGVYQGNHELSRFDVTKQAILDMLGKYDGLGDTMVQIVTFSDGADTQGNGSHKWLTVDQAIAYVNGLDSGDTDGGTYYDDAINQAQDAWNAPGKIDGAQNVSYFFSDGEPSMDVGGGFCQAGEDHNVDSAQQTAWQNFLNDHDINSYAVGLGPDVDQNGGNLNPIAYDGVNGVDNNGNVIIVDDLNDLADTINDTVPAPESGGALISGSLTEGANLGADGGHVQSVKVDGVTYTYNPDANNHNGGITTQGGTSHGTYNGNDHTLTVETGLGGKLVIDLDTGEFTYSGADHKGTENVEYVVVDGDGDTASSNLTITVREPVMLESTTTGLGQDVGLHGEYYGYNDSNIVDKSKDNDDNDPKYLDGKDGRVHGDDGSVGNLDNLTDVKAIIAGRAGNNVLGTGNHAGNNATDASFVATKIDYQLNDGTDLGQNDKDTSGTIKASDSNLADFLSQDSGSAKVTSGLGDTTDGIIRMAGSIYMADNFYDIRVVHDDGFQMTIGGILVGGFDGITSSTTTEVHGMKLNGGFQDIELLYWDQGGQANLQIEMKLSSEPDSAYKVLSTEDFALFGNNPEPVLNEYQDIIIDEHGQPVIREGAHFVGHDSNDDLVYGTDGKDVIEGNAGKDILHGEGGNDKVLGGAGDDQLYGGIGGDTVNGGEGHDLLSGGKGDDSLAGGAGDDVFKWELNDQGIVGSASVDTITDFGQDHNGAKGADKLDLSDLLVGEDVANADLSKFLHLSSSTDGKDTVIDINTHGQLNDAATNFDQQIVLKDVDLHNLAGPDNDQSTMIKNLIDAGKLNVDHH